MFVIAVGYPTVLDDTAPEYEEAIKFVNSTYGRGANEKLLNYGLCKLERFVFKCRLFTLNKLADIEVYPVNQTNSNMKDKFQRADSNILLHFYTSISNIIIHLSISMINYVYVYVIMENVSQYNAESVRDSERHSENEIRGFSAYAISPYTVEITMQTALREIAMIRRDMRNIVRKEMDRGCERTGTVLREVYSDLEREKKKMETDLVEKAMKKTYKKICVFR